MEQREWFAYLWVVLLAKAVVMIFIIMHAGIGLGPDEAQYWTWSQYLDWGYYSKPPAIAWQIWLGTQYLGNTELGVRIMSVVVSFLLSIAVFFLAIACNTRGHTAFWAGTIMALSPLGVMASFFAITDGGMVLFWTIACIILASALAHQRPPNYYLLGIIVLCGALFKWPIYLFWLLVLLMSLFYPALRNRHLLFGVLISLLGLLPSLIWNISHDWVTFRHVLATVIGGHAKETGTTELLKGNVWDFLGAQALLLSPIFFIVLLASFLFQLWRVRSLPAPIFFCGSSCFIILLAYGIMAIFEKVQGNWCDFAYPSGIVFLCWCVCEKLDWGKGVLKAGLALSLAMCAFAFCIPYIQSNNIWPRYPIPFKMNAFKHNVGWDNLTPVLMKAGYNPHIHFLFGDKYQTSSILSFYGPYQKRAYFLNLHGIRLNQFSFWPSLADEQLGKTGFFVLPDTMPNLMRDLPKNVEFYQPVLSKYFREVQYIGVKPLFDVYLTMAKGALIFKCIDYNGREAPKPNLY